MRFRAALKCAFLLLVFLMPFAVQAQQAGTVRGTVLDPDQLVVPGATVTLTSTSGKTLSTESKADGTYSIANVPAGTYSFTVTMSGFAAFVRMGVRVAAGQPLTIDAKMSLEEQATEVNVTTQTNQVSVDQDSNASATVIKDKDLDALSDDPDELSSQLSALAGPAAGPNGGQIYVDGFTGGTLPPKSSIREIRINQNPFSAQYDRLGFGRVEVFTRPGTDKYHGNLNIQGNHRVLNTNNPFVSSQPDYHTVFLMGSISGPLTKVSSFTLAGNVRDIEDNNLISGATLYATAADPTALCPPGRPAGCSLFAYNAAVNHPQKRWQLSPRIDWALGDKNTLTVRYQHVDGSNKNNAINGFSLQSRGQDSTQSENTIQISDSQIFSTRVINETRFEWQREKNNSTPQNTTPSITVNGSFSSGGNPGGISDSTDDHFEFQNYTSLALTKHFIRMGGRLRAERQTLTSTSGSNGTFTYGALLDPCTDPSLSTRPSSCAGITTPCSNQTLSSYQCGLANQYSVATIIQPSSTVWLNDVGLYAEDDWKLKPNFTVSAGIRLEAQNGISSAHDFAPRLSFAWGVPNKKGSPTTVIRAGYGIFYDRFDISQVMNTFRQNGTNVRQLTIRGAAGGGAISPTCTPTNVSGCAVSQTGQTTIYTIGANTRSSYTLQFAAGIDRQIGKASVSLNYLNAQGVHQYMNRAFATSSAITYRYDSGGVFRQNQLFLNGNYRPNAMISLFGFYSLSFARGNTSGAGFNPSRATSTTADYGRTSFDIRHRMTLVSSLNFKHGISASPFLIANSGSPYNIQAGNDLNGDSIYNDRPAFLPGLNTASCTDRTTFNTTNLGPNIANYQQIPINYCQGPANFTFNLRVGKVFGFGERTGGARNGGPGGQRGGFGGAPGGGPRGGGGGGRGPGGGGPGGPMGGGASSGHKYTLNLGAQATDLFNVVNRAAPVGTLSSPQFGRSTQLSGGAFGQSGQSASAAVRRITLQLSFNF